MKRLNWSLKRGRKLSSREVAYRWTLVLEKREDHTKETVHVDIVVYL